MDYEKKYKEALERAKKCHKDMSKLDGVTANMAKDFFEETFPELKESEDEKMREMAIKAVYAPEAQSCIKSWGINPDDVIAWLEKQGEKQQDERYEHLENLLVADDIYQMAMNDEMVQEAKEKAVNALSEMCIGRLLGVEKQGEQKPAGKLSKDQEYILNRIVEYLEDNSCPEDWKDLLLGIHDAPYINQKPAISNNALREGISHFGITQYQIDNWLKKYVNIEKQSEHKPVKNIVETWKDMRLEVYQQASGNRHEPNYSDDTTKMFSLNDIDEIIKKMSEQKPTDEVKPKFKVGDWCIDNEDGTIFQIVKVLDNTYTYKTNEGNEYSCTHYSLEIDAKLWTIQDAKDGDILVAEDWIVIFRPNKYCVPINDPRFYCHYDIKSDTFKKDNEFISLAIGTQYTPATKEQRDLFFQKMKEAGYEWDFEVKELNKIEKKPFLGEEEKQLLLQDLCARLPYKVRCKCVNGLGGGETKKGVLKYVGNCYGVISNYYEDVPLHSGFVNNVFYPIENVKLYLRPMSSITVEEGERLEQIAKETLGDFMFEAEEDGGAIYHMTKWKTLSPTMFDYLNSIHIDYRGLIEKGLAIKVTEENNPYKE